MADVLVQDYANAEIESKAVRGGAGFLSSPRLRRCFVLGVYRTGEWKCSEVNGRPGIVPLFSLLRRRERGAKGLLMATRRTGTVG